MSDLKINSVHDITSLPKGGIIELAYKLGCHIRTIERWPKYGIPDKYWPKLDKLYGIKPYQCFLLNAKIRGYSNKILYSN